jgi:eukaryotic-like serine/threonine-protein kinase
MIQASDLIGGRYRLENPITPAGSQAGPGEAWQAVDLIQRRSVAVRLLPAQPRSQPSETERFRAAASLARKVSHPCVAQVFDYGERDARQTQYLVTELVDAPTLAGLLAVGPLQPAKAMDVVARAASGLHAAHSAGLAHGDIKPDSLLVSPAGQVKITDFVISCCAEAAPAYQAPERADDAPPSLAGDLYSLGVVACECLTGTPAFTRTVANAGATRHGRSLPPLPREVPAAVAGLIDELTAWDPAKRPVSAERVSVRAGLLRDSAAKRPGTPAKRAPAGKRNRRAQDPPAVAPDAPAPGGQDSPSGPPQDSPAVPPHDAPAVAPHDAPTTMLRAVPTSAPHDAPTTFLRAVPTSAPHDAPTTGVRGVRDRAPHGAPATGVRGVADRAPHDAPARVVHDPPTPALHEAPTPPPVLVEGHTAILSLPPQAPSPATASDRRRSRWPLLVAAAAVLLAAVLAGWLLASAFTQPSP